MDFHLWIVAAHFLATIKHSMVGRRKEYCLQAKRVKKKKSKLCLPIGLNGHFIFS